jgi:hypothetical protein
LSYAQLQGADLSYALLQGADLVKAILQGAGLGGAQLQGTDLREAQLYRADFATAHVFTAVYVIPAELGLSDLQGADFTTPLTDDDRGVLHAAFDAISEGIMKRLADERLGRLLAAGQSADQLRFTASRERQVLVSDPKNPLFADISTDWLIASPTPAYTSALVALLADELASGDPVVAGGIAVRAVNVIQASNMTDWHRSLYTAVACRLLANAGAKKVKLEQWSIDGLSEMLRDQKIECEPAKPAAPH